VANATAGIKLVVEAFSAEKDGFWYGYHRDAHTSLVGVREGATRGHQCFASDKELEEWLDDNGDVPSAEPLELFAYPAQSNMNGRRLPLDWAFRARNSNARRRYCLLDAAGLVSTSPLDLNDAASAPDFTVLSFYKIFGFPDLGALIVRKDSAEILRRRRYFGGGTVDTVVCLREQWHAQKMDSIHAALEDGTLPFHSIMAVGHAIDLRHELYGPLQRVSEHTAHLAHRLYDNLASLRHGNGQTVCEIYKDKASTYGQIATQGPIVAFNMRNSQGAWVSNTEVEKVAEIKNIHLRSGGLCNPGGIAESLDLAPWQMKENFSAGFRCGHDNDIMGGKPTGVLRVSLGAMSTLQDVDAFVDLLREFFVEPEDDLLLCPSPTDIQAARQGDFYVESLAIYPIKSCAGWKIPPDQRWDVKKEGLAWDREWCLVHEGTGAALSQKRYPKMALIRPSIDLVKGVLRVRFEGYREPTSQHPEEIVVPLSADPTCFTHDNTRRDQSATVCGDPITAKTYSSPTISAFFSSALGVPCQLARFPASSISTPTARHAKAHLQRHDSNGPLTSLLLSNESPILTISRSSLNRLNEQIKATGGRAVRADAFRANIVLAQDGPGSTETPYIEDEWSSLVIGGQQYRMLGPCRRCQMVCVDQRTAEKMQEPFCTLAKTRRGVAGRVYFGVHTCHVSGPGEASIMAGEIVRAFGRGEDQALG